MNTDPALVSTLLPQTVGTSTVTPVEHGNLCLTATEPGDMATCQKAMILWVGRKIEEIENDAKELRAAYQHAKAKKWKTSTLYAHALKQEARVEFYQKMKMALEHGYVIVPNFPVTAFAIRTTRGKPLQMVTNHKWSALNKDQKAQALPAGKGDYKNPFPEVWTKKIADAAKPGETLVQSWAEDWKEFEFPINMARVEVMEAASNAMALKIFDQLGILPSPYKKQDPIIVGQLLDPRGTKYSPKLVTFMIAWHLDTRTL
jgi:hypothetical protein